MQNGTEIRKLDLIDRKILLELDTNARVGLAEVGKKLRIGKNNVQYRLARMTEDWVVKKFATMVSNAKLGYFLGKFYLQLSGFDKKSEEEFYRYILNDKRIIWVAKCEGRWDLMLGMYVENIAQLGDIKWDLFKRYEKYINSYDVVFSIDAQKAQRSYLVHKERKRIVTKKKVSEYIGRGKAELDETDKRILLAISDDGRYNYVEVGKKLGLNPKTVQKRIKAMEEQGVINGYVAFLDYNRIGVGFYKVCLYLKDYHEKYRNFMEYCLQLPNVIHVIEGLGPWEVELEMETESVREFYDVVKEIRGRYSDIIKKTEFVIITDEMKLELVPQILMEEKKKGAGTLSGGRAGLGIYTPDEM
jgi:DNA-binding Lrp family transcriptional regulator